MPQASTRLKQFTFTIPISTALSQEVDLLGDGSWLPVAILMPAGWDAAAITAIARNDPSQTAGNLFDAGTEWSISVAAGRYVLLSATTALRLRLLQLRSGTAATPVNQTVARTLTLICRSED